MFVCRDMKYHTHSRSGHSTVIINMAQTLKCAVSDWAPLAHFNKRSEDIPTWHSGHNRTSTAEFGPMRIIFGFTVAQLYREVAIMNHNCVVIGPKSARSSPLPVSRAHSKFERLSVLYLQQYSPAPFHSHTSYQATSKGVSRVKIFFAKCQIRTFGNCFEFLFLAFFFFWLWIWYESIAWAAGGGVYCQNAGVLVALVVLGYEPWSLVPNSWYLSYLRKLFWLNS